MSQTTPRKFSEKIAILERKQNEEQEQFSSVIREVRTITGSTSRTPSVANSPYTAPSSVGSDHYFQQQTSNQQSPNYQQQQQQGSSSNESGSKLSPEGPHPMLAGYQGRQGGSLPNVHQVVQQQQQQPTHHLQMVNNSGAGVVSNPYNNSWSQNWQFSGGVAQQQQHPRTRSPGAVQQPQHHFHPYRSGAMAARHERMSHGDATAAAMSGAHLQPPDQSWPKARSDPAIHTMMSLMDGRNVPNAQQSNYIPPGYPAPTYPGGGHHQSMQSQSATSNPNCQTVTSAPTSANILPPNVPIAFFPPYPLANQPTMKTPFQYQSQQQQQQQQMYQMQSILPQQIGQPSSSTAVPVTAAQYMVDLSIGSLPNMSFPPILHGQPQQTMQRMQQAANAQQQQPMSNGYSYGPPLMMYNNNNINYQQSNQQQQQSQRSVESRQQQQQQQHGYPPCNSAMRMPMSVSPISPAGSQQQQNHQLTTPPNAFAQSQSAPTSPAQTMCEHPLRQQWPPHRHFSASPEGIEVPNICVTGTDGGDIDCFQDLQDLHLDNEMVQMLKEPGGGEQVDPACETQLLS